MLITLSVIERLKSTLLHAAEFGIRDTHILSIRKPFFPTSIIRFFLITKTLKRGWNPYENMKKNTEQINKSRCFRILQSSYYKNKYSNHKNNWNNNNKSPGKKSISNEMTVKSMNVFPNFEMKVDSQISKNNSKSTCSFDKPAIRHNFYS